MDAQALNFLVKSYLKKPYKRIITPQGDEWFKAEIPDFPGLYTVAAKACDAAGVLEGKAYHWIMDRLVAGKEIPEVGSSAGEKKAHVECAGGGGGSSGLKHFAWTVPSGINSIGIQVTGASDSRHEIKMGDLTIILEIKR
jgi:hypothetical protein